MARILVPLPDLQLDPRNTEALLNSIQTKIYLESNGALNDFTPASPLSALTEGQAYAQSELLYYLNFLPEAFVLQWLKLMGIQRVVGSHSYADLVFLKQPGYSRVVYIPQGTEFYSSSGLKFVLLKSVELIDDSPVTAPVRSDKWGTIYNVPAGTIVRTSEAIVGLGSFYNPQPASGGESEESVGEMKSRALTALSRRSLTTKEDYIFEVQSIFPDIDTIGIYTYSELSSFIDNLAPDIVYVCYANSTESIFTSEYMSAEILKALQLKTPIGTDISLLSPEYNRLRIDVLIEYSSEQTSNLDSTAGAIFQALTNLVSFTNKPLGSSLAIDEISEAIELNTGLATISNIKAGALKLYTDAIEPTFGVGCSDEYETIIDEDGICSPDYFWEIDNSMSQIYVPNPIELYTLYEANISMLNVETANTITFTYKNV